MWGKKMGMDREKWLAMRNTPRKTNREKMIFTATNIGKIKNEETGEIKTVNMSKGKTFRRTQDKG